MDKVSPSAPNFRMHVAVSAPNSDVSLVEAVLAAGPLWYSWKQSMIHLCSTSWVSNSTLQASQRSVSS